MVFAIHQYEFAIGICVSPPSWTPFPPPSPPYSSVLSQSTGFRCPESYTKLVLVICFTYGNIYVSMLFSQIIPPSPSPTEECFWDCVWQCFFTFRLFIFGCAGSLLLRGSFSVVENRGYPSCSAQAPHCSGFSCCTAWALGHMGFSICDSQALEHRLNSCGAWA